MALCIYPFLVLYDVINHVHYSSMGYWTAYMGAYVAAIFIFQCIVAIVYNVVAMWIGGVVVDVNATTPAGAWEQTKAEIQRVNRLLDDEELTTRKP